MTLRSGLAGQWCSVEEVTYGVAPSLTSSPFILADSDTLKLKKVTKEGAGIYAGALVASAARRVVTEYSAGGGLPMDLPQRGMNKWLYRMMGSYGQTPAALTEDASTSAYSATHALGPLEGHTFTLQAGRPTVDGTVEAATYVGCKITEWEIAASMGEVAKLTLTIEARNELMGSWKDPLNGSVPSLLTFAAPPDGIFHWAESAVYYGGTPSTTSGVTTVSGATLAGNVKGPCSFKLTRGLDLERFAPDVAPFRNEPVGNALVQPSGSMVVEWLSAETYLAAYQNDTATCIEHRFTGPAIGSGSDFSELSILVPNVRLDGDSPSVAGTEVLTQTVPWVGLDDRTNNVVQALYWTLDAT